MSARVAVVGAGIFGCTCAAELGLRGHQVTLFEAAPEIMSAASAINQCRLHRGYHYPRSLETAVASRDSERSFRATYGEAVIDRPERYYAISAEHSLTSGTELLAFCDRLSLPYRTARPSYLEPGSVEISIQVEEGLLDVTRLREIAWERMRLAAVDVRLRQRASPKELDRFDVIVASTYAGLNDLLAEEDQVDYQFEVIEKPLVRPPRVLAGQSIVVLDGPFVCLDPVGRSELSVLGHVVHAIHHRNVGRFPEIPANMTSLLNRGVVARPPFTKFRHFVEAGSRFVPELRRVEHVGSMFTIRTVFPYLDATDARPTLVRVLGERVITVFSGKIGTCVQAAEEVVASIAGGRPETPVEQAQPSASEGRAPSVASRAL